MTFPFKTIPYSHQLAEFETSRALPARAYWWEPGVGKTKPAIDTAASLFMAGEIQGLVVLAPNNAHFNWSKDELPVHLPEAVAERSKIFTWRTQKRHNKGYQEEWQHFVKHRGLCVLCMSYDALMTDDSAKLVRKFMQDRRCMYVLDEADKIKNPGAQVSKRVIASAKWAPYRRVLSGTPVDNQPFDVYSQAKFADGDIWFKHGLDNFSAFKTHFAEWDSGWNGSQGREFKRIKEYKNLDEMQRIVLSLGSRILKKDVLDLPDKIYKKVYFQLTTSQRRMYEELQEDYRAWFGDGSSVTAEFAMVRMMRLQQLVSGYLPADEEEGLRPIEGKNPRLDALHEAVELFGDRQFIVWSKYNIDVDCIVKGLADTHTVAVYDGRVKQEDRYEQKAKFLRGDAQVFVSKPSVAGRAITLNCARGAIYYNNSFRQMERSQSEDRCHRAGMGSESPLYVDLVAEGTIDEYIIDVVRRKKELAACVMGDELPKWL